MLGTVDRIDYDGERVLKVVLRFPSPRAEVNEEVVKEITTCERVGQGSFGTVYRALCDGYPNLALKIATGKSSRLKQELDVLSKACTKGKLLLPRFEFGALNKSCDLIVVGMELCVPRTMHDFLISEKLTSEADKLFLAYQATQAVSYIHEAGCIHRDIKLQNFVFDLYGNVKLIDFGLACNSLRPPPGDVVAGTVSFMAPEMAHNALYKEKRVSVGAPGDIWSLGIVLFSIFTQRNPYPTVAPVAQSHASDEEGRGDETESNDGGDVPDGGALPKSALNSQGTQSTRQRLTNERLLKRVAAGEWRWPAGCTLSGELKRLVEGILVKDASKRPSITEVLSQKIWNLRRRAPPESLEQFLGVQDDFLFSRDETHLLRAVEERNTVVAASLHQSRVQSVDGGADSDKENSGASQNSRKELPAEAVSPTRPNGSLKVVTKEGECEVGGVPTVRIYDVRASAKKHSKPIREIGQAIAEETANVALPTTSQAGAAKPRSRKGSQSATSSKAVSRSSSLSSNSKASSRRNVARARATTFTADEEDVDNLFDHVLTAAAGGNEVKSTTSSSAVAATAGDGLAGVDAVTAPTRAAVPKTATVTHSGGGSSASSGRPLFYSRSDTDADLTAAAATAATVATAQSSRRAGSISLLGHEDGQDTESEQAGSDDDSHTEESHSNRKREVGRTVSNGVGTVKTRSRDPSLKKPSSSLLLAGLVSDNGFVSSASSRPRSTVASAAVTPRSRAGSARAGLTTPTATTSGMAEPLPQPELPSAGAPPLLLHPTTRTAAPLPTKARSTTPQDQLISHRRKPTGGAAVRRTAATPPAPLTGRDEGESKVVDVDLEEHRADSPVLVNAAVVALLVQQEAARRSLVSKSLLVEHEWLLASFRLTIEEDQERYNITWLAEEQAKSASHPHKFEEKFQLPSKKYQYGFVCDFCDYEFLPTGRTKKDLHFFHCRCGRDLCPECFEEYRHQCTCTCCGVAHPNSCALRDHVRATGGRGGGRAQGQPSLKGTSAAASGRSRRRGRAVEDDDRRDATEDGHGLDDLAIDDGPANLSLSRGLARTRKEARLERPAGKTSTAAAGSSGRVGGPKTAMHVSVAAMYQREEGGGLSPEGDLGVGSSSGSNSQRRRPSAGRIETPVEALPDGPWRPFAKLRRELAAPPAQLPTPEEREMILNGEWVRYFYLYPNNDGRSVDALAEEGPFAFVYHIQPGRTGAVFLSSEFPMHSAVFSLMERQFFIVDQVNTLADDDITRITTLVKAKSTLGLSTAYHALQEIVSYDTNLLKLRRAPGTVSVYQAPRSVYGCHGDPYVFVRWFRFNEDRSLSAFLLSNGAVQVFVNNEFELRWFDENRKFLVRCNGVCEVVGDSTFTLAPAINQLLYGSFDT